jgi:UDP-N-acetylglucosamine--N-acetylmuramyl-(pentapeptide) pyrophosphoryl-undecaprenol N-acetylglucosamine transferase
VTDRVDAVVAGGGTAGHVLPGLAIARALVDRGCTVHYVGAERGIEARLVPPTGIPVTLLPGRGIQRRLTPANLGAVAGIVRAAWRAVRLVRRLRPRVVVGVGGFASVPCVLAAVLWRVPIVVAEQNTHPGAANRLAARFAKATAVAFPGTPLPRAVLTGNPVRPEVLAVDRAAQGDDAKDAFGIPRDRAVVLVAGGSLGALSINRAVAGLADRWSDRTDVAIRHVVGERDWDAIHRPPPAGALVYQQVRYEDDMPRALAAADLGVFRSGSSMCFELAAVGLPSVLVPSPFVTGDHQTGNARLLAGAGGAVVVPDADLTPERLDAELSALLADRDRRAAMTEAVRSFARPDAAERVAALALQHARSPRGAR